MARVSRRVLRLRSQSCTLALLVVERSLIRLRRVLLVLVVLFAVAMRQAAQNKAAYTLPPEKLKIAKELFRLRTTLHFVGEGWGILQVVLLLGLGVPARMRDVAENATKSRWVQCFVFVFFFLGAMT